MTPLGLHPEIAAKTDLMSTPDVDGHLLPLLRQNPRHIPVELSDNVLRVDHAISDNPRVEVRVHQPKHMTGLAPCIYSMHGGGYVFGSNEADDGNFDHWCQAFGVVGVSVEYRLAPETPFPGPLEDCYAGLKWVWDHALNLGVDREKIGITGISAGGGLCAALAMLARDRGEVPVQFQMLDCPMLDDRQETPSSQDDRLVLWSRKSSTFGWQSYLGALYGSGDVPPYAAPARATDLAGLPEAYVCVGGADGFRDEAVNYALKLCQAGVPTELRVYPGAPHGVSYFPDTDVAQRYQRDQRDWLGRQVLRLSA